ncbi:MAG: hypothetical protein QXI11_04655 [Thermoproteota archaeon]
MSSDKKETLAELGGGAKCIVQRVSRQMLLENINNWNRLIFFKSRRSWTLV